MKPIEDIHSMELHEQGYLTGSNFYVIRVPGGLIYYERLGQYETTGHTFVPLNDDLKRLDGSLTYNSI